jgi:hypothetical protein
MSGCPNCEETDDIEFSGKVIVTAYESGVLYQCNNLECRVNQFIKRKTVEELQINYGDIVRESSKSVIPVEAG